MKGRSKWEHTYPTYSSFRKHCTDEMVYPGGDAFKYNRCDSKFNRPSTSPAFLKDYDDPRDLNDPKKPFNNRRLKKQDLSSTNTSSQEKIEQGVSFDPTFPKPTKSRCESCAHVQSLQRSTSFVPLALPSLPFIADERLIKFDVAQLPDPQPVLLHKKNKMLLSSLRRPAPNKPSVPDWSCYVKQGATAHQPAVMRDAVMARRFAEILDTCVRTHEDIRKSFLKVDREHARLERTLDPMRDRLLLMASLTDIPQSRSELEGYFSYAAETKKEIGDATRAEMKKWTDEQSAQSVSVNLACPLRNWKTSGGDASI